MGSERQTVTVYLYQSIGANGDRADELPERLGDFIDVLLRKLTEVPPEFRDKTFWEHYTVDAYGFTSIGLDIYYRRPETDEELSTRLHREEKSNAHKRDKELAELKRLKEKYESR